MRRGEAMAGRERLQQQQRATSQASALRLEVGGQASARAEKARHPEIWPRYSRDMAEI